MVPVLLGLIIAPFAVQDKPDAPLPPISTNAAYQQGIKEVSELLESGDFAQASIRAKNLPDRKISVQLSFEGIDAETQKLFQTAAQASFNNWKKGIPSLDFSIGAKPQIKISLVKSIGKDGNSEKTLVLFPSPDPSEPALEAVLALDRLSGKAQIDPRIMTAEVNFIIGQFLGLEQLPSPQMTMFRIDGLGARTSDIDEFAKALANKTLAQSDELRGYIQKKQKITAAFPEMFMATRDIDFKTVTQGENQQYQLEIVNRGKAPLTFTIRPDCSCFVLDYKPTIEPGATGLVTVYMSTTEFQGHQDKGLFVYTNDAENAVTRISVHGTIRPAYRLRTDKPNAGTYLMTPEGLKLNYILYADGDLPFEPRKVSVSGVSAAATIYPWEGEISDPELFEGTQKKKGYRIEVLVSPSAVIGRTLAALMIQTDSEIFPKIAANFFVQKGVSVNPKSLYFGDVEGKVAQAWIILEAPKPETVIQSVESGDKRFSPRIEKIDDTQYRVMVTLNAGSFTGTLLSTLTVKTNDPDTPEILIPVQAYVH